MADLITKVACHKFYSKVNLKNAYLQIQVDDESQKYLMIDTYLGLCRYKQLPFGIHCCLAIFHEYMAWLLSSIDNFFSIFA